MSMDPTHVVFITPKLKFITGAKIHKVLMKTFQVDKTSEDSNLIKAFLTAKSMATLLSQKTSRPKKYGEGIPK